MAHVFLAQVEGPGGFVRHLIVKTMQGDDEEPGVAMFLDEARLLATLHHQNIAQVFDLGVDPNGTCFLAMEYVHGETLHAALHHANAAGHRLPLDFALTVVECTAAALHHAHERCDATGRHLGIVHRDVTPGNVMTGFDGAVKLIDFGIAKAFDRSSDTLTGIVKGKTRYMAPEQVHGSVDRRTDVFGLGVVLYELTTQVRAFPRESVGAIVEREVLPPSAVRPGYYPVLEDVVMTAMARDPGYRFPDADALGRAVRAAAAQLGVTLGPGAIIRTMERLFGHRPEPWLSATPGGDPPLDAPRAPADDAVAARLPRARRGAISWAVVPTSGALAAYEPTVTDDATMVVRSLEVEAPEPCGVVAAGSWSNPRLVAQAELEPGGPPSPVLLEIEAISDDEAELASDTLVWPVATKPVRARPAATVPAVSAAGVESSRAARPGRHPRTRALIAMAASLTFLGTGLAFLARDDLWRDGPVPVPVAPAPIAPRPPPAASADAPVTASVPPRRPQPPPRSPAIRVVVTSDPTDATVLIDGIRLGRTPLAVELRRELRTVWLKIRRRGHTPRKIQVPLADDLVLHLTLSPRGAIRRR